MNAAQIRAWLAAQIGETLHLQPSQIDDREPFDSYGMSSREAVALSGALEELLGRKLSPTLVYDYPSIGALSRYLGQAPPAAETAPSPDEMAVGSHQSIAIVGIGCRFPGANDPPSYWQLLRDGIDMIREVPRDRWDASAYYHPDATVPGKAVTRWGGFLDQVDRFDPFFFGISPGEAERMDPQHRLLMELAYESFEDAGYSMKRLAGTGTGVFVGISINEYALLQFGQHELINGHSGTGNALAIAANRISYFFDLRGPSMAIDTACSSSLMAVHLACHSLRSGECELALAGGVNIMLSPAHSIAFTKAGVLAPDGRCKSFAADANGYVRGEGGGLVLLKPLAKALADRDSIYAVIRGSAAGQDGRTNGLMAPSREAQEAVLLAAYRDAEVSPGRVQYVEAHGTGTLLGDAIEARALGAVLSNDRRLGPCAIGSVKSNIGHLEAAAGVAGLVKVALSLKHGAIPPSLHFSKPNPHVPFADLGLRVQRRLAPWPERSGAGLAAVSSFGFGGTNVHVVLEEAREPPSSAGRGEDRFAPGQLYLLPLSAHSPGALEALAGAHRDLLAAGEHDETVSLHDVCVGASLRRNHLDRRVALAARSKPELVGCLDDFLRGVNGPDTFFGGSTDRGSLRLAFMFSGQGAQWLGMGRELLKQEATFRGTLGDCDAALRTHVEWSLLEQLTADDSRLAEIDVLQPTLFALQVALANLWRSWGVEPDAVVGHSMGEVAAAHVAGALSLEDATRVICARSRLLKRLSGQGGMAVVGLSSEQTEVFLAGNEHRLSIAARNSPISTVVSGDTAALTTLTAALERAGIFCALVNVDVPSHSPQTVLLSEELRQCLEGLQPRVASLPFVSTVTGAADDGLLLDAGYWASNLREPVDFSAAIQRLVRAGHDTFLEISTHSVLQSSVQQTLIHLEAEGTVLPSLRREEAERSSLLRSLATLYASGRSIDWNRVYPRPGRPVALPTYPWQRTRFWMDFSVSERQQSVRPNQALPESHPLLGERMVLARAAQEFVWQTDLDPLQSTFLGDHRVAGEIVVPMSAFVEMALSAAASAGIADTHGLCDLDLCRSLLLPPGALRRVQVALFPGPEGVLSLGVYSQPAAAGGEDWTLHLTASFVPARADDQSRLHDGVSPAIQRNCSEEVDPDELYRALAKRGLEYGPSLRGIKEVWRRDGEALGRASLSDLLLPETVRYQIHPALLDAALQVLAATQPVSAGSPADGTTYVPVGCRRVKLYERPGREVWSHAVLKPGAEPGAREVEADVRLLDESGHCIAELTGFRLVKVARDRSPSLPTAQDIWLYDVRWQRADWPPAEAGAELPGGDGGNRWLILADRHGLAEALAKRLEARGQTCQLLGCDGTLDTTGDRIAEQLDAERSPLRGVIHLWSAEVDPSVTTSGASLRTAQTLGCDAVLSLVQGLVARSSTLGMPRLWLVTRGAQPVLPGESVAVGQAPLWGLAKSIGFELPELKCTLVDLDVSSDAATASELLFRQLCISDHEDQVALRGCRRLVPRLLPYVPSDSRAIGPPPPGRLRADGTYLIAGGLGGLGLTVARWMIERGARHLALVGRTAPGPAVGKALDDMRRDGADIVMMTADIGAPSQLARVLERIRESHVPLRGVVHAAGALENGPIVNLDPGSMSRVMAPKVDGAWNLHTATANEALDFFVLFSSAVSVLGSPGQGNYAAANSFLDALSHYRRSCGLPAISINWGPWAEVGLVADGDFTTPARPGTQGVKGITPARGLEVLGRALQEDGAQMTVLPFDLRSLLDLYPTAAKIPLFAEVGGKDTHVSRLYGRPNLRQGFVAPRNEIERKLAEVWRQTLRIDRVGVRDSFFELGGDSVLAAQVVTSAYRIFGVGIDLRQAFELFTIENLASRVESALMAKIADLSEHEARQLLEE